MNRSHKELYLTQRDERAIRSAKEMVTADLSQHYTIPVLSRRIHLNECKLKAGFKQVYGKGIWTYLSELRLEKAKEMLAETDLSVKEVAFALGYRYAANFITSYKRKWSRTPGSKR